MEEEDEERGKHRSGGYGQGYKGDAQGKTSRLEEKGNEALCAEDNPNHEQREGRGGGGGGMVLIENMGNASVICERMYTYTKEFLAEVSKRAQVQHKFVESFSQTAEQLAEVSMIKSNENSKRKSGGISSAGLVGSGGADAGELIEAKRRLNDKYQLDEIANQLKVLSRVHENYTRQFERITTKNDIDVRVSMQEPLGMLIDMFKEFTLFMRTHKEKERKWINARRRLEKVKREISSSHQTSNTTAVGAGNMNQHHNVEVSSSEKNNCNAQPDHHPGPSSSLSGAGEAVAGSNSHQTSENKWQDRYLESQERYLESLRVLREELPLLESGIKSYFWPLFGSLSSVSYRNHVLDLELLLTHFSEMEQKVYSGLGKHGSHGSGENKKMVPPPVKPRPPRNTEASPDKSNGGDADVSELHPGPSSSHSDRVHAAGSQEHQQQHRESICRKLAMDPKDSLMNVKEIFWANSGSGTKNKHVKSPSLSGRRTQAPIKSHRPSSSLSAQQPPPHQQTTSASPSPCGEIGERQKHRLLPHHSLGSTQSSEHITELKNAIKTQLKTDRSNVHNDMMDCLGRIRGLSICN
eukprot:Nk52_evm4s226 gene=Nk52_evmTU4s226